VIDLAIGVLAISPLSSVTLVAIDVVSHVLPVRGTQVPLDLERCSDVGILHAQVGQDLLVCLFHSVREQTSTSPLLNSSQPIPLLELA